MSDVKEQVIENNEKLRNRRGDIAKIVLVILLGLLSLGLEVYGFEFGCLRYMAIVIVCLVAVIGMDAFTKSYNRLLRTENGSAEKSRIKLAAEKAAALGAVSLTFAVAFGLYSFDASNSEANTKKLLHIQLQMTPKAKSVGCQVSRTDTGACKEFYDALDELWEAVLVSDTKAMSDRAEKVRIKWGVLSVREPLQSRAEFSSLSEGLNALQYWSDSAKQQLAFLLALLLLPFSVAATSRKLAVAAFEAGVFAKPVTWRAVAARIFCSILTTVSFWRSRPDAEVIE